MSTVATENGAVGSRVKALRDSMGLSLRDLAERWGVSAPMLSQVERGETSPTLAVAGRIASGLDLTLSQLLRLDESRPCRRRSPRRRPGARPVAATRSRSSRHPCPGQRADVSRHALQPGAATGGRDDPPIHEPGASETALVLAGTVTLLIDGDEHPLAAGDAVTFDADLPHHFENRSDRPAEFIGVVAAGLRRS